jgi:uncharacterized protein
VNAVERLGMTDHGPVHVKIVMNIADKLFRLLTEHGCNRRGHQLRIDAGRGGGHRGARRAPARRRDVRIHRADHETYSLFIAERKAAEILGPIYDPARRRSCAPRCCTRSSHRSGGKPLTLEAGIVRVADALDMAKGRSRIPFSGGSMSIHSVSAAAIEAVHIEAGESRPVRLRIELSNSAGIFQLDQLFREKLGGSGLEAYVELEGEFAGEEEKRIVERFRL